MEKKDCITSANTRRYYYDKDWRILDEYDGSNTFKRRYMYGNYIDEVLFSWVAAPGTHRYYVHDHLYSPVALLGYDSSVLERYEYDAYGEPNILEDDYDPDADQISNYDNSYLFTGRQVDVLDGGSLKIQYNRNRYYDYYTGRWTTQEPLGIMPRATKPCLPHLQYFDGVLLYSYAVGDPVLWSDPLGLWRIDVKFSNLSRCYAGDLILYNDKGKPLFYAVVRGQGHKIRTDEKGRVVSRPWWRRFGDTPTGEYKGRIEKAFPPTERNILLYGRGPHIRLTAVSGNAKVAATQYNRSGLLIHAGRDKEAAANRREVTVIDHWEEIEDDSGNVTGWRAVWKKRVVSVPYRTGGCLRLTQSDKDALIEEINKLLCCEKDVGKVTVSGPQLSPPK